MQYAWTGCGLRFEQMIDDPFIIGISFYLTSLLILWIVIARCKLLGLWNELWKTHIDGSRASCREQPGLQCMTGINLFSKVLWVWKREVPLIPKSVPQLCWIFDGLSTPRRSLVIKSTVLSGTGELRKMALSSIPYMNERQSPAPI